MIDELLVSCGTSSTSKLPFRLARLDAFKMLLTVIGNQEMRPKQERLALWCLEGLVRE